MASLRPLNVGLVGGGCGAFIAQPHQKAIFSDGTRRVVAAALHPDPEIAMKEAENWPYPIKGYKSYDDMINDQKNLPEEERLDYILIVTPNFVHYDPAMKAIEAGIPVMCEKPLTVNLQQADDLVAASTAKGLPFAVAHTYLGHWSSQLSRFIVTSGLLGDIRWVDASYIQGWLAKATSKSANWRCDPKFSGGSLCLGDIGTHALMQLRFVTDLDVTKVSAHMESIVNMLDDHSTVYCELSNGAKAMVRASQVSIGHKNDLALEVVGSEGTLIWRQEESEKVTICLPGQPDRVYWRGNLVANDGFFKEIPEWLLTEHKIPGGHAEGFHDAYARLHREFEKDIRAWKNGEKFDYAHTRYATVLDGRMGLAFIDAALKSNEKQAAWEPVVL